MGEPNFHPLELFPVIIGTMSIALSLFVISQVFGIGILNLSAELLFLIVAVTYVISLSWSVFNYIIGRISWRNDFKNPARLSMMSFAAVIFYASGFFYIQYFGLSSLQSQYLEIFLLQRVSFHAFCLLPDGFPELSVCIIIIERDGRYIQRHSQIRGNFPEYPLLLPPCGSPLTPFDADMNIAHAACFSLIINTEHEISHERLSLEGNQDLPVIIEYPTSVYCLLQ